MADETMDVDRVMMIAISDIVNGEPLDDVMKGLEGVREELPEGARFYLDMAMELLVEGDVDEAEKCLWAARCGVLRERCKELIERHKRP